MRHLRSVAVDCAAYPLNKLSPCLWIGNVIPTWQEVTGDKSKSSLYSLLSSSYVIGKGIIFGFSHGYLLWQ